MRRLVRSRLSLGLVLGALLAALVAAPAQAAHHTRWVDDDGGSSGGPAACSHAGFTSIQDAIDASSRWDTVKVCPGTYTEQLTIDVRGLTVKSVWNRGAHIVAPELLTVGDDGVAALVRITSYAGRLVGFELDIAAGDIPTGAAKASTTLVGCSSVDVAIFALGQRNRVNNNFIDSTGDYTYSGECGYYYGIVVGDHLPFTASFGSPYPRETSKVRGNVVRDFKAGGILVEGAATKARVVHNSGRFQHLDDPYACDLVPVPFGADVSASACASVAPVSGVNGGFDYSFGIAAEDGALVDIYDNEVFSSGDFTLGDGTMVWSGIALLGVDGDSKIRGNDTHNTFVGIAIGDTFVSSGVTASSTPGIQVKHNTMTDSYAGIIVDNDANDIHHNRSRLNLYGTYMEGGADNVIHDNDFRFNLGYDCYDTSSGSGTEGTANTWFDNLGTDNDPAALCTGPF